MFKKPLFASILFTLIFTSFATAQNKPVSSYTVSSQDGACISTGSIKVSFPAPSPGVYESGWVVELTITDSSLAPQALSVPANGGDVVFGNLSPGKYDINVSKGGIILPYSGNPIEIKTTYVTMKPTVSSVAPTCKSSGSGYIDDGKLTINVPIGGIGPFQYTVNSPTNGTQTLASTTSRTHTFLGMKSGENVSYSVRDLACNSTITSSVVLNSNAAADVIFADRAFNLIRDCSSANCSTTKLYVNLRPQDITTERLNIINTPGNATITIAGNIYPLKYLGFISNVRRYTYDPMSAGGPVLTDGTVFQTAFNYGCNTLVGGTTARIMNDYLDVRQSAVIDQSTCSVKYRIAIFGKDESGTHRTVHFCPTNTVKIEKRDPVNTSLFTTVHTGVLNQENNDFTIYPNADLVHFVNDPGVYRITASDNCHTVVKTITIPPAVPINSASLSANKSILQGTAGLSFSGINNLSYPFTVVLERVDGQTSITLNASNPMDLAKSYTVNFPLTYNFSGPSANLVDLPLGQYKIKVTDACTLTSGQFKTLTANLTAQASYDPKITVLKGCVNNNSVNYELNADGNTTILPKSVELRIKNANGSEGAVIDSKAFTNSGTFNNVPSGNYYLKFSSAGDQSLNSVARNVSGPFSFRQVVEVLPYENLNVDIATVFCDPGNSGSGIVSAEITSGTLIYPLTMALYSQADPSTPIRAAVNIASPSKGTVFTGLTPGNYFVRTTSVCYTFDQNLSLNTTDSPPKAQVSDASVCPGSPVTVAATSATNNLFDITWLIKNQDNTETIVGKGMPINFSPTSTTTYTAKFQLKPEFSCGAGTRAFESDVTVTVTPNPDLINPKVSDINLCQLSSTPQVVIKETQAGFIYEVLNKDDLSFSPQVLYTSTSGDLIIPLPSHVPLIAGTSLNVRTSNGNSKCGGLLNDPIQIFSGMADSTRVPEGDSICAGSAGKITIKNSELNIVYTVLKSGQELSPTLTATGTGSDLVFTVPASNLTAISNEFTVRASYLGCTDVILDKKVLITTFNASSASGITHVISGLQKGEIIVNASGGSGNYEYSINNVDWLSSHTFSELEAGNYTMYARDKTLGCVFQYTVEVVSYCFEITKTSKTNPNSYKNVGDVLSFEIVVKNIGATALTNLVIKDPLTGLMETIANLDAGSSQSFTTSYTVIQTDLVKSSVDNTATLTFTFNNKEYSKTASASVNNAFNLDSIDCEAFNYAISANTETDIEVLIAYKGGVPTKYGPGAAIPLNNGTLTATLQAGEINPEGGYLVYRIVGTPSTTEPVIVPVNFGGLSCNATIYILDASETPFYFSIFTYNDKNKDCVKDSGESQDDVTASGMYIKVFDLNDKLLYVNPAFYGQFDVNEFNGVLNQIYYYIIDTNDSESDITPTLPVGWHSAMSAPSLKRYFHYDGSLYLFNTAPVNNLLDASWDMTFPLRICLNQDDASISELVCGSPMLLVPFKRGLPASTLVSINYRGGNGGYYPSQSIASTGVLGLTALLDPGSLVDGDGRLNFTVSGTPNGFGPAYFAFELGGQTCQIELNVENVAEIKAIDDDFTKKPINSLEDTNAGNVLSNDLFNDNPITPDQVNISVVDDGGLTGITIDKDGNIIIPKGTPAGSYVITYRICEVVNPTNCSEAKVILEVFHGVDLRITKSAEFSSIYEGGVLHYVLSVKNVGKGNANNVQVVDDLPDGLRYISSTVTGSVSDALVNGQKISWNISSLAAGASVEIKIKVKVAPLKNGNAIRLVNTASVSSKETEIKPEDNNSSASIEVKPFFIPNTITPNGDMINDTFVVPGLERFVSNELHILNRWNDNIYQAKEYKNDWAANGIVAGTYFYILKTKDEDGKDHVFKGYIQIVKERLR